MWKLQSEELGTKEVTISSERRVITEKANFRAMADSKQELPRDAPKKKGGSTVPTLNDTADKRGKQNIDDDDGERSLRCARPQFSYVQRRGCAHSLRRRRESACGDGEDPWGVSACLVADVWSPCSEEVGVKAGGIDETLMTESQGIVISFLEGFVLCSILSSDRASIPLQTKTKTSPSVRQYIRWKGLEDATQREQAYVTLVLEHSLNTSKNVSQRRAKIIKQPRTIGVEPGEERGRDGPGVVVKNESASVLRLAESINAGPSDGEDPAKGTPYNDDDTLLLTLIDPSFLSRVSTLTFCVRWSRCRVDFAIRNRGHGNMSMLVKSPLRRRETAVIFGDEVDEEKRWEQTVTPERNRLWKRMAILTDGSRNEWNYAQQRQRGRELGPTHEKRLQNAGNYAQQLELGPTQILPESSE
ncbi:hypothetical protein R3P38DRAFT_2794194 [Favolaschia claudopus]|uniref:Uncharacterized protein n=1 Tax=Favolaschia claudopus TaxID=2862362 RepID=A0AAW0AB82_9AGAR